MIKNKVVGFTCSCFDLLHSGHIAMLREAHNVCDYLIVGLQTDPTAKIEDFPHRKTKRIPVQTITERYMQLKACKYIDEIVVYETEDDLLNIFKSYPIDIRIIGEEYKGKGFTGKDLGGILHEVYYNSRKHNWSTTNLLARIRGEKH